MAARSTERRPFSTSRPCDNHLPRNATLGSSICLAPRYNTPQKRVPRPLYDVVSDLTRTIHKQQPHEPDRETGLFEHSRTAASATFSRLQPRRREVPVHPLGVTCRAIRKCRSRTRTTWARNAYPSTTGAAPVPDAPAAPRCQTRYAGDAPRLADRSPLNPCQPFPRFGT